MHDFGPAEWAHVVQESDHTWRTIDEFENDPHKVAGAMGARRFSATTSDSSLESDSGEEEDRMRRRGKERN